MNGGDILFDALGGVSDRLLLETEEMLKLGEGKPRGRANAKLWKTALIAAALALLLAAAAYAAGLLHWKDQTYAIEGTNRVIVVPNGLRGTKTYEGTAAWWSWAAQQETWTEPDWSFTRGDDALRKTCETYRATTPEAAVKLREIAETYDLELYSESFTLTGRDELYELSGMQPYVKNGSDEVQGGYIFPDGSFYAEGCLVFGETKLSATLQRVSTGALYPFAFPAPAAEYTEREYRNALGQSVNLVLWENGRLEIWYLSEDGEMFAALRMYDFDRPSAREMRALGVEKAEKLAEFLADHIDFSAVCANNGAARSLAEEARGASDNPDAAARLEAFYESNAFCAAREFQNFFTEHFYGACFTGVYGQSGYEDISAKLSELAEWYDLRYASAKTQDGNNAFYDNGAFYEELPLPEAMGSACWLVHYIPKDALYTRMTHYTDFAEYRRVWNYKTVSGQSIICATDGPEKISGSYLFYETDDAYVLVNVGARDASLMERAAETIDWTAFDREGDGK